MCIIFSIKVYVRRVDFSKQTLKGKTTRVVPYLSAAIDILYMSVCTGWFTDCFECTQAKFNFANRILLARKNKHFIWGRWQMGKPHLNGYKHTYYVCTRPLYRKQSIFKIRFFMELSYLLI